MSWVNFWFWMVVMEEVRGSRPSGLTKLKAVVEAFSESVNLQKVKRSARSTWNLARACRAVAGTSFKGSLKTILKGLVPYVVCPVKSSLKMTEKITISRIKVLSSAFYLKQLF